MAILVLDMEGDVQFHVCDGDNTIHFKDAYGVSVCLKKHPGVYGVDWIVGGRSVWRGSANQVSEHVEGRDVEVACDMRIWSGLSRR